jgi:polyisoprenoid-binding protein YceI
VIARPAALGILLLAFLGVPAGAAPNGGPVTLAIDPQRSSLTFTIHRPGETIDGAARAFTGEVVFDPADLSSASSVVLRVTAASLETGNRMRDRKMRNAHLEVDRFPEIVFKSTSIKVGPEREGAAPGVRGSAPGGTGRKALVEGVLSLHGVDRTLMVPAAIRYDNGTLIAEGSVALTYSDYGIPIPRFLWLVMEDDIKVRFRFVAGAPAR